MEEDTAAALASGVCPVHPSPVVTDPRWTEARSVGILTPWRYRVVRAVRRPNVHGLNARAPK
jgi:hypothetical protein